MDGEGRDNTLYLSAPSAEFERLSPVLGGVLADLKDTIHAWDIANRHLDKPLLIVIDEAAHLQLGWLPTEVSTIAALGAFFVTCWQNLAQINHRYDTLADAVLSGHRTKCFFAGIDDLTTARYLTTMLGHEEVARRGTSQDIPTMWTGNSAGRRSVSESTQREEFAPAHTLREMIPGEAVLLHGTLPPIHLTAVRHWEEPDLAKQIGVGTATTATCPLTDKVITKAEHHPVDITTLEAAKEQLPAVKPTSGALPVHGLRPGSQKRTPDRRRCPAPPTGATGDDPIECPLCHERPSTANTRKSEAQRASSSDVLPRAGIARCHRPRSRSDGDDAVNAGDRQGPSRTTIPRRGVSDRAGSPAGELRCTPGPKAGSSAGNAGAHRRGHGPQRASCSPTSARHRSHRGGRKYRRSRHAEPSPTSRRGSNSSTTLPTTRSSHCSRNRWTVARRAASSSPSPTGHASGPPPQPRTTQRSGHRDRHRHLRTPPRTGIHRRRKMRYASSTAPMTVNVPARNASPGRPSVPRSPPTPCLPGSHRWTTSSTRDIDSTPSDRRWQQVGTPHWTVVEHLGRAGGDSPTTPPPTGTAGSTSGGASRRLTLRGLTGVATGFTGSPATVTGSPPVEKPQVGTGAGSSAGSPPPYRARHGHQRTTLRLDDKKAQAMLRHLDEWARYQLGTPEAGDPPSTLLPMARLLAPQPDPPRLIWDGRSVRRPRHVAPAPPGRSRLRPRHSGRRHRTPCTVPVVDEAESVQTGAVRWSLRQRRREPPLGRRVRLRTTHPSSRTRSSPAGGGTRNESSRRSETLRAVQPVGPRPNTQKDRRPDGTPRHARLEVPNGTDRSSSPRPSPNKPDGSSQTAWGKQTDRSPPTTPAA